MAVTVRATTTTTAAPRRLVADPLHTAASPVRPHGPALLRVVAETALRLGEGRQAMSVAGRATAAAPGATLSHPAAHARAPSRPGLVRPVLVLVRTTLPPDIPVARGHPAGHAEATAVTTSGTVGPGRPEIKSLKILPVLTLSKCSLTPRWFLQKHPCKNRPVYRCATPNVHII